MKYHNILHDNMLNGDGLRAVLFVSGCTHHCKGCHNPITWNPNLGLDFDDAAKQEIFDQLDKNYIAGVTFSGGDPLYEGNIATITALAKEIKAKYPNKTIWCYTGGLYEEYKDSEIMNYLDVLCDGEYVESCRDTSCHWVGSTNQRVIDVKKTRETGKIVLHGEKYTSDEDMPIIIERPRCCS